MLKKITENVEIHQTLPDIPNLTSEELKKEWDKGSRIIKQAFNELINELNDAEVLELKERRSIFLKLNTAIITTDSSIKIPVVATEANDKLIYSDNKITIGVGVSKIKISAKATIKWDSTGNTYKLCVKKNGEVIVTDANYKATSQFTNISIVEWIENVAEGDVIELYLLTDSGNTTKIGNTANDGTAYMTIKIVE